MATGAITQVRTLGGVIGIAVVQAVLISHVTSELTKAGFPPAKVALILESTSNIAKLDPLSQTAARAAFGAAVNLQFRTIAMRHVRVIPKPKPRMT